MKPKSIISFFQIILLVFSIWRYNAISTQTSLWEGLFTTLLVVLLSLLLFAFKKEEYVTLRNNYYKVSFLFLVGFLIVHFVWYLGYVVGEYSDIIESGGISTLTLNRASILSSCCLITYILGYSHVKEGFYKKQRKFTNKKSFLEYSIVIWIIIFYYSAGSLYFQTHGNDIVLNSTGLSTIAIVSQTWIWASIAACSLVIIYKGKPLSLMNYIKSYSYIYYISILLYSYLVLSSGDRGPLIYIAICYTLPYFIINQVKLKLPYTIIAISAGAFVLSILATVRSLDGDLSIRKVGEAVEYRNTRYADESLFFTSTDDISTSIRAYNAIYDYTEKNGHMYGLGVIDWALSVVPGVRPIVYSIVGINVDVFNTALIATIILGADHGMGTTCVGDTYFNAGFWGTLIIFFFWGLLVRKVDISTYNGFSEISPFYGALILSMMSYAVYIGRATFPTPVNLAIYTWVFFVLNNLLYRNR